MSEHTPDSVEAFLTNNTQLLWNRLLAEGITPPPWLVEENEARVRTFLEAWRRTLPQPGEVRPSAVRIVYRTVGGDEDEDENERMIREEAEFKAQRRFEHQEHLRAVAEVLRREWERFVAAHALGEWPPDQLDVLGYFLHGTLESWRNDTLEAGDPHADGHLWQFVSQLCHTLAHPPASCPPGAGDWLHPELKDL
jgi:hypothetical protein